MPRFRRHAAVEGIEIGRAQRGRPAAWQLFPAPQGFGNIPVWGFGEVIASSHPMVSAGERLFGYLSMATHLGIEATDVSKRGLRGKGRRLNVFGGPALHDRTRRSPDRLGPDIGRSRVPVVARHRYQPGQLLLQAAEPAFNRIVMHRFQSPVRRRGRKPRTVTADYGRVGMRP
jgi:Protein of unknown function (DUF2855)